MKNFILIVMCLILFGCKHEQPSTSTANKTEQKTDESKVEKHSKKKDKKQNEDIPNYVYEVLQYVTVNNEAPQGYVGGRTFQNREKRLPLKNENGNKVKYQEWDVHPKEPGKNRGAERLVTDNEGNAYYTSDHYKSFQKINYSINTKP